MKRVFIIHGWEGKPDSNWFPWLTKELEARGFEVAVPQMPDAMNPTLGVWLSHVQKIVGEPSENTFLIGHSLGVITILRFLEALGGSKKIGGAILVAGFSEPIAYEELNSFFQTPLDYEKIKASVNKIVAIHSDNDPHVPMRNGELLRDHLGAELIVLKNAGHINGEDGFTELPIVLGKIIEFQ